jgi:hypothetical protein
MTTRRSGRRGPVVLREAVRPRRRRVRGREAVLSETLEAPLPGQLLVLLSQLHRSEQARGRDDEATG